MNLQKTSNLEFRLPFEIESSSFEQTFDVARNFASLIQLGDFVAIFGTLGAGKTVFAKGLCSGLGFAGDVFSPTFTVINEYGLKSGGLIVHCDMYRVLSEDDLLSVGFFDYLTEKNVVVTEWSENIERFLPSNCFKVTLSIVNEQKRLIKIKKGV